MPPTTVIAPSIMNIHLQAASPSVPDMPAVMPALIKPEKAPERSEPEYRNAIRKASSFLVYHDESRKRAPGTAHQPRLVTAAIKLTVGSLGKAEEEADDDEVRKVAGGRGARADDAPDDDPRGEVDGRAGARENVV